VTVAFWNYGNPDILPTNSTAFEAQDNIGRRQLNVHLPWGNSNIYWDCGDAGNGYDRINQLANTEDFEGQWNHWAFTKNATTGVMNIYLNGELWLSGTDKNNLINVQDLAIGSAVRSNSGHFGKMDDFAIWSVALDAATIQDWMRRVITDQHPNYDDLVLYFPLNEGAGNMVTDYSSQSFSSDVYGSPNWRQVRGKDHFKNFESSSFRPYVRFVQGDFIIVDQIIPVLDSFANAPNMVISYEVQGTDLVATDTSFLFASADQNILDELGQVIGTLSVTAEGRLVIESLEYYSKFDAKYEILSLVTPYGNGLDLGPDGATFTIDLTEYAPILRGERFMSIEMGGQNQEELDIKFLFITGTPPRDIVDIQNVWPFRRGWYDAIQANTVFEPRDVALSPEGEKFVMRSSVTGHGQNGEFIPRYHYISFNEGAQEIEYYVWKECADNPMYPQGGTWLFDRAGWCPGLPTDIHEVDFSIVATPGGNINVDYGVNGAFMNEANYLVSNQLVTYGALNFSSDASLESVIRPTLQHEYQRRNPACNLPIVEIRNNGVSTINSIEFNYWVDGSSVPLTYTYEGTIFSEETKEIELPVDNSAFWVTPNEDKVFHVEIVAVNGAADEYSANDSYVSSFELPELLDESYELQLYVKTNNRASENAYTITDYAGNVVLSRNNMANATEYEDAISLPPGCYTLTFEDTGDDGLSYWYWDLVDPSVGTGLLKLQRIFNGFPLSIYTFETEFGGTLYYDFAIGDLTDVENIEQATLFSVYPNPATEAVTVELRGYQGKSFEIEVVDLNGRVLRQWTRSISGDQFVEEINTSDLTPGMYYVRVSGSDANWIRSFVKQ
ncbi:MAG: T9SS type A sorting domain-containing protein, partial [Phaeodactylibacter sp.]|nr:T9SS type A sorting domain-containing protein [Phaeodactylibacter sp.]